MSALAIQAFDHRHPIIVNASEIRPGDWISDLGTLLQVDYVDTIGWAGGGAVHIVRFKPQAGAENLVRGISNGARLIVWRTTPPEGPADDAEA